MKVSACIITLNEEKNLERCLKSLPVGFADEIIVLDSGSTDRTERVAKSSGARFEHHPWTGFVAQKNEAIRRATFPWILSLDADEEVSPRLAQSLSALKSCAADQTQAYEISRVVVYQGREIRSGNWYPDHLVRLFPKDRARFEGGQVHERLVFDGNKKLLDGDLLHHTCLSLSDRKTLIEKYARLWAEDAAARGKRCGRLSAYSHALGRWARGFLWRSGWKEGLLGWRIAANNALEAYLKYHELYRIQSSKHTKSDA